MLRKAVSVAVVVLLLGGCGAKSPAPKSDVKFSVPTDCESRKILAALPSDIPNPKWIDTKWEPAPGTDLYSALNTGGLACTYGNQSAEIGTTIIWAPSDSNNFETMSKNWGMSKVDIPGINEESAYWLGNEATGPDEIHRWSINLLYKENWIQVNASYIYSMDNAIPLIKAAIGSLIRG